MERPDISRRANGTRLSDPTASHEDILDDGPAPRWPMLVLAAVVATIFGVLLFDRYGSNILNDGDEVLLAYVGFLLAMITAMLAVVWYILFGYVRSGGK